MRFTSILVAGALALVASAQSTTAATATTSASNAVSSEQAAIMKCLEACPATDVTCQSKCIAVPSPNESQVNQTTECVAKCDQSDADKFAACRDDCIGKYYFTSGGTPAATGGSGSGSAASGSATAATGTASGSGSRATGSGTATGTSSSSSGTSSPNAAPALVGSASFGFLGLIGALLL